MKILFICTGNSCRSAMAKGYLDKRLKELGRSDVQVSSAGTAPVPGMKATEEAKQVMMEAGGDISGHYAMMITTLLVREADLIFVMERRHMNFILGSCPEASSKTYFLKDFKKLGDFNISDEPNIRDPIGRDINFYREVFTIMKESVERILKEIKEI